MGLRSPLSRAKGMGPAKSGVHHWWLQRVTAIALVPLVIWFSYGVIKAASAKSYVAFVHLMESPFQALAMTLFVTIGLYHGALGMREVIVDYVHNAAVRLFLLITIQFASAVTGILFVLAILKLHLNIS
tara:strand:+ start:73 stop:459 length:387 start_codon:yes stop_codon:yes gene_type:complete